MSMEHAIMIEGDLRGDPSTYVTFAEAGQVLDFAERGPVASKLQLRPDIDVTWSHCNGDGYCDEDGCTHVPTVYLWWHGYCGRTITDADLAHMRHMLSVIGEQSFDDGDP